MSVPAEGACQPQGYAGGMTIQIAVKLPDDLVRDLDRLVADGAFRSRSQAVRSGLEAMVEARRREEIGELYADALARSPETGDELSEAARSATEAIREEPWERWW